MFKIIGLLMIGIGCFFGSATLYLLYISLNEGVVLND